MRRLVCLMCIVGCASAQAGWEHFEKGPVIDDYGPVATIDGATLPASASFKIAFDISDVAEQGKASRYLESAARLLNMHARAGAKVEATQVAIVVHGAAAMDLVNNERYGGENASAGLIAALIGAGVSIQLCGQTAAYRDIAADDLLPGITMSVSAMTAHAVLQQDGFTLNPF